MIKLFIVENIVGATMVGLFNKMVAFVKDEGTNLTMITTTLKSIFMSNIHLLAPFARTSWAHVMSKITKYATNDNKVCQGFQEANLKSV